MGYGLDYGHQYAVRSCQVARAEPATLPINLTNWYLPWFPSATYSGMSLVVYRGDWDGSTSVTLNMKVRANNHTTIHVQGALPEEAPPDSMAWKFDQSLMPPDLGSEGSVCPPEYCLLPQDNFGLGGCVTAAAHDMLSVKVHPPPPVSPSPLEHPSSQP